MNRLALLALALAACTDDTSTADPPPMPDGFVVAGSAADAPSGSKLVVLWEVTTGADALVKFGDAPAAKSFAIGFAKDPPPQAINAHGVAVGAIALLDAAAVMPADGANVDEAFLQHVVGFGDFVEVVWRGAGIGTPPAWSSQFPEGYACGRCVLAPEGMSHDSFVPTTCDVTVTAAKHICNWQ